MLLSIESEPSKFIFVGTSFSGAVSSDNLMVLVRLIAKAYTFYVEYKSHVLVISIGMENYAAFNE